MTLAQWLSFATASLHQHPNAKQEAIWTLEHFTQCNHARLKIKLDDVLPELLLDKLNVALQRRAHGEPLAYILGNAPFWTLDLDVSPSVLIPRQETEALIEWTETKARACNASSILDLGTGSGAIALSLAASLPKVRVLGIDLSEDALAIARTNQTKNNISNVTWLKSSWFKDIPTQKFDLIVSNPPYLDRSDDEIHPSTIQHEPHLALFAAQGGLKYIKHILETSREWLTTLGWFAIEHGHRQGDSVRAIAIACHYRHVSTHQDLGGRDRFTVGCWTESNAR